MVHLRRKQGNTWGRGLNMKHSGSWKEMSEVPVDGESGPPSVWGVM